MNKMPTPPTVNSGGLEITNTRVFDASREAVFDAFANRAQLAQWWGPNGFTTTITEFDLRPGGPWRLIMHGPDGKDYANVSQFVEVARPDRIVFEHLGPMHWYRNTMTCVAADDGQTRLTWQMLFERTAENENLKTFIAAANEQNFDRLAAVLRRAKG